MAPKSESPRGLMIFMVVLVTAYTWYLIGTGNGRTLKYFTDHGLPIPLTKSDEWVESLVDWVFVIEVAVATHQIFLKLVQAEAEKCPRYLSKMANFLILFACGYVVRLIAAMIQEKGFEVFENLVYLFFMVLTLMCASDRYKEFERESRESQVEMEAVGEGSYRDSPV